MSKHEICSSKQRISTMKPFTSANVTVFINESILVNEFPEFSHAVHQSLGKGAFAALPFGNRPGAVGYCGQGGWPSGLHAARRKYTRPGKGLLRLYTAPDPDAARDQTLELNETYGYTAFRLSPYRRDLHAGHGENSRASLKPDEQEDFRPTKRT
jgi:hypothetical protein